MSGGNGQIVAPGMTKANPHNRRPEHRRRPTATGPANQHAEPNNSAARFAYSEARLKPQDEKRSDELKRDPRVYRARSR